MSLMAGFDVVIEISKGTIEKLMLSKFRIDNAYVISGNPLAPPFELKIPTTIAGLPGFAYIIVTDPNGVQLATLTNNEEAVIKILFTGSSLVVGNLSVSPLAGTLNIAIPLLITGPMDMPASTLIADLTHTQCDIELDPTSIQTLAQALAQVGIPSTPLEFIGLANTAIQNFLASLSNARLAFKSFQIDPNQVGDLEAVGGNGHPLPRFVALVNHNIADQALGLFGILIPTNQFGDVRSKSATAIPPGEDVAISISPQIFQQFYFCPALAAKMLIGNETSAALPPPCGSSLGKDFHNIVFTTFSDSLGTGHVNIDAVISKTGPCYDASGPIHAEVAVEVSGGQLTPSITSIDTSKVVVNVKWWCYLGLGAIGFYIYGWVGAAIADVLLDVIVHAVAGAASSSLPIPTLAPQPIPNVLESVVIDNTSISPEGFTLLGTVKVPAVVIPAAPLSASMVLNWDIEDLTITPIGTGSYDYKCKYFWCVICPSYCCFKYDEYRQHQNATLGAAASGFYEPIKYEWQVGIPGDMKVLSGASGTVNIQLQCQYPQPLPVGTTVSQRILIGYTIAEGTLVLEPDPFFQLLNENYGNFVIDVAVRVSDPTGQSLDQNAQIQFQGDRIQFSSDYDAYMGACIRRMRARAGFILAQAGHIATTPQPVPPEGGWNPEGISSLVGTAAVLGQGVQEQVLEQANMRFGPQILVWFASGKGLQRQLKLMGSVKSVPD